MSKVVRRSLALGFRERESDLKRVLRRSSWKVLIEDTEKAETRPLGEYGPYLHVP